MQNTGCLIQWFLRIEKKIKIVSIITGLANGGTEKMLLKLLEKVDRKGLTIIISLTSKGDIESA